MKPAPPQRPPVGAGVFWLQPAPVSSAHPAGYLAQCLAQRMLGERPVVAATLQSFDGKGEVALG